MKKKQNKIGVIIKRNMCLWQISIHSYQLVDVSGNHRIHNVHTSERDRERKNSERFSKICEFVYTRLGKNTKTLNIDKKKDHEIPSSPNVTINSLISI